MPSMLKSTVLSIGLLAATALAAQAQSVSSLPPNGGAPTDSAATQPNVSPPSIGLSPGATSAPKVEHYEAAMPYASSPADHPYSAAVDKGGQGLKPN